MALCFIPQIIAYCKILFHSSTFWLFTSTGNHPTISLCPLWTTYCSGSTASEALFVQKLGKQTLLVFSYITSIYYISLNFITLHFISLPNIDGTFCERQKYRNSTR